MTYSRPFSEAADRAKRCRDRAEQCRAWADLATHQVSKLEFMDVSRQWDELAKEIEGIERAQRFLRNARRATARLTGGPSDLVSATHLAGGKDHL
jgi:DNA repair ATPase RecN